jgi:hypothetical protein
MVHSIAGPVEICISLLPETTGFAINGREHITTTVTAEQFSGQSGKTTAENYTMSPAGFPPGNPVGAADSK